MRIESRLRALETRPANHVPEHRGRMSVDELDAELARIGRSIEQHQADDNKLRAKIGEAAFSQVLAQRQREEEARQARVAAIVVRPEWLAYGFDTSVLSDDEFDAAFTEITKQFQSQ